MKKARDNERYKFKNTEMPSPYEQIMKVNKQTDLRMSKSLKNKDIDVQKEKEKKSIHVRFPSINTNRS